MQIGAFSPCCSSAYQGLRNLQEEQARPHEQAKAAEKETDEQPNKTTESNPSQNNPQEQRLTPEQQKEAKELQERDREVRAHEAAHKAAAGGLAKGAASFSYQRGPDGKLYATGGEVSIDTSKVSGDPQATLQKANQIRAAALAPAHPSSQDHAVAADAAAMAAEARQEISSEQRAESQPEGEKAETSKTGHTTENQPPQANEHDAKARHYQEVANNSGEASPPLLDLIA